MVCKILESDQVVVHDLRLHGQSSVKHQIDITIKKHEKTRHILIECKEIESGNKKVGLGIVRNFESAVRDIKAREAWIISNVGFTKHAARFAESKGIDLKIIRLVECEDLDGIIKQIVLKVGIVSYHNVRVSLSGMIETEIEHAFPVGKQDDSLNLVGSNVDWFFRKDSNVFSFNEYISLKVQENFPSIRVPMVQSGLIEKNRKITLTPELDLYYGNTKIEYDAVNIEYDVHLDTEVLQLFADRIAELIVSGFGRDDILIFDHQIAARHYGKDKVVE